MRNSPLRLEELFFPQVSVKALLPANPESADRELNLEDLDISFALNFEADNKRANAGLEIASKPTIAESSTLYEISIKAFANFKVTGPEHQDAMAVYLRKFAAAAALIGAAREQVALMTARGPWGVVMLPIISMDRVVGPPPKKSELNTQPTPTIGEGRDIVAAKITPKRVTSKKKVLPKNEGQI